MPNSDSSNIKSINKRLIFSNLIKMIHCLLLILKTIYCLPKHILILDALCSHPNNMFHITSTRYELCDCECMAKTIFLVMIKFNCVIEQCISEICT